MIKQRLEGAWQVLPAPLEEKTLPADWAAAISVPECTQIQLELYPDNPYWGDRLREINEKAWIYRRTFTAPLDLPPRARLHFEGVDYFAEVWLNGQQIGAHEGAFVPFTLEATEAIQPGDNELMLRVWSPWDAPNPSGTYPTDHVIRGLVKGFYEHGEGVIPPNVNPIGIWRPVWLLLDGGVGLSGLQVETALDGTVTVTYMAENTTDQAWSGELVLTVTADNHDGPGTAQTAAVNLPPGETITKTEKLTVPEPRLWWPWDHGKPNLYQLQAVLASGDGLTTAEREIVFGIRTVELDRSPERFVFRVNGRPIAIRGTSYMPGLYLSQVDEAHLQRDLDFALEAHLNLLRVHVHVSPPELYDLCDRAGMLILQDFELSWIHDPSPEFEGRARPLQRAMMTMLYNHPAIMGWVCHNEPTMVYTRRQNLEQHPDPALYADATALDQTRTVFICSGQLESDWRRSGDAHTYYGALWSKKYTDIYRLKDFLFHTEFGFEAPAAAATLRRYADTWDRLGHLEDQIPDLWAYQEVLLQFHIEHIRRQRANGCAGYIQFWLADLVPQVGCGVLDAGRVPKGGYTALKNCSAPLLISLEHDGKKPAAVWVFNDTLETFHGAKAEWCVYNATGAEILKDSVMVDIGPNSVQQVEAVSWVVSPQDCIRVTLALYDVAGETISQNAYDHPFQPLPRPVGYPWKFDLHLGCKVFDRPGAPSLVDQTGNKLAKIPPRKVREFLGEWGLRQRFPTWLLTRIAWITDRLG